MSTGTRSSHSVNRASVNRRKGPLPRSKTVISQVIPSRRRKAGSDGSKVAGCVWCAPDSTLSWGDLRVVSVHTQRCAMPGGVGFRPKLCFLSVLPRLPLWMVLAGKKLADWGPRRLAWMGGVTLGAGYLLAALNQGTNFWTVLIGVGSDRWVPVSVSVMSFPLPLG